MNFTCPHCGSVQIVTEKVNSSYIASAHIGEFNGATTGHDSVCIHGNAIRCANIECNKPTVYVNLSSEKRELNQRLIFGRRLFEEQLYPKPSGKPFPSSVPAQMLEDYNEAWSIINLSPKSSATLARRCLQAMIHDFCKIRARTLYHEIEHLEKKLENGDLPRGVDPDTVEAMRALKDIGNIGAHMTEVDGKIVNVEPGEAQALLGVIEMLFNDWYVARDKRAKQLAAVRAISAKKKGAEGLR